MRSVSGDRSRLRVLQALHQVQETSTAFRLRIGSSVVQDGFKVVIGR
jgi:hypothetical protein